MQQLIQDNERMATAELMEEIGIALGLIQTTLQQFEDETNQLKFSYKATAIRSDGNLQDNRW